VVKLDDKEVRLESDLFLKRYAVSTDGDQEQLAVWQLFSPGIIQWLTTEAPERFSFELQDGALACFVPGYVSDEDELHALCAGAARIFARVVAIDGPGAGTTGEGTRRGQVERELAEHPFEAPPQSIKAAAKAFRHGLVLGDRAWGLGAEAFFRGQAALVGWTNLVVETSPLQAMALASSVPRGDTAERGSMQVGADGPVTDPDHPRRRPARAHGGGIRPLLRCGDRAGLTNADQWTGQAGRSGPDIRAIKLAKELTSALPGVETGELGISR
jgi:hypothetical protein